MRLLLTLSTPICRHLRIWPYFFSLSITRVVTPTSNWKCFLENLSESSGTVSCVDGTCEASVAALLAFVGVKLSAMIK